MRAIRNVAWGVACGLCATAASGQILIGGVGGDCPDFTASCPAVFAPVICSDGQVYQNLCAATVWGCATDCVPTGGGPIALPVTGGVWTAGNALDDPAVEPLIQIGGDCPDFTAMCPANFDPVICSDGNTYPNLCAATVWGCASDCVPTGGGGVIILPVASEVYSFAGASEPAGEGPQPLIQIGGGDCPDFTASCPDVYAPVLCADGNIYPNSCAATVWGCTDGCVSIGDGYAVE